MRSHFKPIFLLLTVCAALLFCQSASAQHCRWRYDQAFTQLSARNLRGLEKTQNSAELQAKMDALIDLLFGPRQVKCEEGAYSLFMERYERYTTEALRRPGVDRDLKLRAAIAAIRKSPEVVDYVTASREITLFKQMRSNIGAIAQDAGMSPLMQQLVDAIGAVGAPKATRRPDASPPDPHVSKVSVPTVPLPPWAVISLYEIDDHTRRNEMGAIQGKVQAILNWMKTVAPENAQ